MILAFNDALQFGFFCRPMVMACGCFDILTAGHVRHLQAAKKLGKHLCVLVTADKHVSKGAGRPVFLEDRRAEVVDALGCVDSVVINPRPTAAGAILMFSPDVYVKGREYKNNLTPSLLAELEALESVGGRLEFTETEEVHTTNVVARLLEWEDQPLGAV